MKQTAELTDLTVCRGVFAAWVFIYHVDLYVRFSDWLGPASGLIRHGYLGVDGFFLLSGVILGRVYPKPALHWRVVLLFWGRRLARLYPVHLVTLLIFGALVFAGRHAGLPAHDPQRFSRTSLWENLALVQGWGVAAIGQWNYPSWSISTEWAGYLAFPILGWLIGYFEIMVAVQFVIIAYSVLGFIAYLNHYSLNIAYGGGLLRFFPEFIGGLATARMVPAMADNAPVVVLVVIGAVTTVVGAVFGLDLLAIIGLWLVLYSFTMEADAERPAVLRLPVLRAFGLLSYSFYMSFAVAELVMTRLIATPAAHAWLFVLGMVAGTFALALALHFAVERPARRRLDRLLDGALAPR